MRHAASGVTVVSTAVAANMTAGELEYLSTSVGCVIHTWSSNDSMQRSDTELCIVLILRECVLPTR